MALMMRESHKRMKLKEFRTDNPGVGDYNVAQSLNFTMNQAASYMIGKSHRESVNKSLANMPGPTNYEVLNETTMSQTK